MTIYFDNVLIDENKYSALSTNFELFDSAFYLGSTAANTFKLSIGKDAIVTHPTEVKIYDDNGVVATLVVDDIEEDDYSYTYTLTDKMVNLDFYYDASEIFNNGSTTLLAIALDICQKAGITLATQDFRGYNKSISWYDNTRTAREYIGYIAELNGGYAQIDVNGQLQFYKQKQGSMKTISINDCSDFKIGEKRKITRVVYEMGALKYEFGNNTGNTLYLNADNVFITTEAEVEAIYNDIKNFEFYNFETTNCPIDFNIKAGNVITFTDTNNNLYPTIAGYELAYYGDWHGGYSLSIESTKQEETKLVGNNDKIKNLQIIVDRDQNSITQMITEIGEQNNSISRLTQTVDDLQSEISNVTGMVMTRDSTMGSVTFEDTTNTSEVVAMKIYPLGASISFMYPRDDLYPSDTLYMPDRRVRFHNNTTNENFYYELPDDLLYYDGTHYDEFYLDLNNETTQVTKRCKYNANGTISVRSSEATVTYPLAHIELTEGVYTVTIPGYNNVYISVTLMAKNIYTDQFYTQVETKSLINQTASSIDLSVNQKLSNYSTTAQMNSAISLSANNITSTVSENYTTKSQTQTAKNEAIAAANADTDEKLEDYSTTVQMNSAIEQTASSITSTVSANYATKSTTNALSSRISQTAKSIALSVNNGSTSSGITITTTKENGTTSTATGTINMTGLVSFSNLKTSGQTEINGANITTGTIKAVTLQSTNYESGTAGTKIQLSNGVIDSKNFKINSSGNVTISGNVTASAGTIGGFTLGSTKLYNGKSTLTANTAGVYIGTDGISLGTGSTFKVTNAGALTASNANITGTITSSNITATGGTIGGWTITSTQLQAHNGQNYAYINNTSGSNQDFLFVENRHNSTNPSDWTYPVIIRANGYAKFDNLDMSGNIASSNISGSAISGGTISGATITGSVISARDTLSAQDINASFSIYAGTEISTNSAYVCQGKWGATTNATVTIGGNIYKFVGGILVSA